MSPRRVPKTTLAANSVAPHSTIVGPTGTFANDALIRLPAAAAVIPNISESSAKIRMSSVQKRAALGGITSVATTRISPTDSMPRIVTPTTSPVSSTSSVRTGSPSAAAKSASKQSSVSSLKNSSVTAMSAAATAANASTSDRDVAAAVPARYDVSPALVLAAARWGMFCTTVSSAVPAP